MFIFKCFSSILHLINLKHKHLDLELFRKVIYLSLLWRLVIYLPLFLWSSKFSFLQGFCQGYPCGQEKRSSHPILLQNFWSRERQISLLKTWALQAPRWSCQIIHLNFFVHQSWFDRVWRASRPLSSLCYYTLLRNLEHVLPRSGCTWLYYIIQDWCSYLWRFTSD